MRFKKIVTYPWGKEKELSKEVFTSGADHDAISLKVVLEDNRSICIDIYGDGYVQLKAYGNTPITMGNWAQAQAAFTVQPEESTHKEDGYPK